MQVVRCPTVPAVVAARIVAAGNQNCGELAGTFGVGLIVVVVLAAPWNLLY